MKVCPYCAEEIKVEAIKCKHCGSDLIKNNHESKKEVVVESAIEKKPNPVIGCIGLIIIIAVLAIGFNSCMSSGSDSNKKTTSNDHVAKGDRAYINIDGAYAAVTKDDFDLFTSYRVAKNKEGIAEMMIRGQIFLVEKGTTVNVVDRTFSAVKINANGSSGWLPFEYVTKK